MSKRARTNALAFPNTVGWTPRVAEALARQKEASGSSPPARRTALQCRVRRCGRPAEWSWTKTPLLPALLTKTWPVCFEHYVRLGAGERWAVGRGKFPRLRAGFLLGRDLETWRKPDSEGYSRIRDA